MRVCVNGEARSLGQGATLADLIGILGLKPRRIAVERNQRIVRRARYARTLLADDDKIEIVTLVGGG